MALAILELVAIEKANVRFKIDTGTNRFYKVKIGKSGQHKYGIDWADEIYYTSPMGTNAAGGGLLNSSKEITIPFSRFDKGTAYVQLFTFKTADGISPAFSNVVKIPMGMGIPAPGLPTGIDLVPTLSLATPMNTVNTFQPTRKVSCRTVDQVYSQTATLDDVLGSILKVAGPVLQNLFSAVPGAGGSASTVPSAGGTSGPSVPGLPGADGLGGILTMLLSSILKSLGGPAVSKTQSLYGSPATGNRFMDNDFKDHPHHRHHHHHNAYLENRFLEGQKAEFARPFIFGIDDALIGSLVGSVAGPFIQLLPQLLNSVNQAKLQNKLANNKLTTDILAGINQRMMMQQLQDAQQKAQAGNQPGAADLAQLIQLLQQAAPAAGTAPATAASLSFSESMEAQGNAVLSTKAVISVVTSDPVPWNGMPKVLFARGQALQFKVRLDVAGPAPKTALPKAILKFVFKTGADGSVAYEKTFKQKNVQANTVMPFAFAADELSHLPANQPVSVLVEIRWLAPTSGNEYKALGSTEIVLVNKFFLKEQGQALTIEQELTDMKRFRPFWNKIWEAPVLDAANGKSGGEKKYLWELDVNGKYSMLLSPDHDANGLMETKLLQGPADTESLAAKTEGRMKAGIELSISELNKLIPLWNGAPALDREHLEAFQTDTFAKNNAGEFIYNFKLKGNAGERGMVWVIPIFKLFDITLNSIQKTDDAGQVTAVADEKVQFPLPVSARLLGLKSQS
jgi:hypothetical protein